MTRNNGLQKSAGSVGSPVNRDTHLYVEEGKGFGVVGGDL